MKKFLPDTIRIPLIYVIFGLLWILLTDRILLVLAPDFETTVHWQTYKGWLFVGLSTLIIYSLVAQSAQQDQAARDALAASEKRYRLLFDNNPLPMWVYDVETLAIFEVNEAAVTQYQYPRPEFLQLNIKEIRPLEDVPLLLDNLAQVSDRLNFAGEWRHQRKDGTVFPVQVVSHALLHNGRSARLVVCQDLTDQKRLEAERTNSFRRNQALVRALGEIVYEWSANRSETLWDGDIERILGYSAAEMGHTAADWEDKIHPDDRDRVRQESLSAAQELRNLNIEYRFRQKDGTYRWMLDRSVVTANSQGKLEKVVGVLLDINERKQTEEALRLSEERFRRAIAYAPVPVIDRKSVV